MKIPLVIAALLIVFTFRAQAACGTDPTCGRNLSNYERVLLPLLPWVVIPGAGYARWQTNLWVANDSTVAWDAFPFARNDCTTSITCRGMLRDYPAFAPGVVDHGVYDDSVTWVEIPLGRSAGGFVYVERSALDHLSFSLHVRDTERGSHTFGTDIPVVRESRFFTVARSILDVPVNSDSRIALRIYSAGSGSIRLRVQETTGRWVVEPRYHFVPPAVLAETQLELRYDAASDVCPLLSGCPSVPYKPATIEISDLVQQLPALRSAFGSDNGVRIEIEPLTPGLAYWPMVSVTSNLTNEVTLFLVR